MTSSPASNLQHKFARVPMDRKIDALATLLRRPEVSRAIIFCDTKTESAWVGQRLKKQGFDIGIITGDVPAARRLERLQAFHDGELSIIVTTDLAAQGQDFGLVSHIYLYAVPQDTPTYKRRASLTARNGTPGVVFTFVLHEEERTYQRIMRDIKQEKPATSQHSSPTVVAPPPVEPRHPREQVEPASTATSTPRDRRLREGEVIGGNFKLMERVGQGTFGAVYRAEELRGGRSIVAVKLFHDEPDEQEMSILASIEHPNILRYRATLEHDGHLCLITDFADGGDAAQMLTAYPEGLPIDQVRALWSDIARALSYLHDRNIAHRDVKPANILFVNGRARLGDVGLAKALTRTRSSHNGTHSVAYAAPEMFKDQVHLKSDIYSLGITIYELLTGKLPFTGSPAAVMFHHLQSEPDYAVVKDAEVRILLGRMLDKDPNQRISAPQLMAMLEQR